MLKILKSEHCSEIRTDFDLRHYLFDFEGTTYVLRGREGEGETHLAYVR